MKGAKRRAKTAQARKARVVKTREWTAGSIRVVDNNVIVIANRRENESMTCANACAQVLRRITQSGRLAVDLGGRIFEEYRRYCSLSGQRGVGDAFVKWAHDNQGRAERISLVDINPVPAGNRGFLEFPDDPVLSDFDPADRKFVAVANKHPEKPPILQASDSKWWGLREALSRCGITVEFLCPDEIEATYHRKMVGR